MATARRGEPDGADGGERPVGGTAGPPAESQFARIAEISADAVITIDADQAITFFNRGAQEIFGYTADEVLGEPLDILLPERFRRAHTEHVREFGGSDADSRRMGERSAIAGLRKSGEEFPAEASIAKLDIAGEPIYAVVLRDITDRRRAAEAQRFLARAGETLTASLEYHETLEAVARTAVQGLADWCVVYDAGPDGTARPLEAAHADPALRDEVDALLDHPLSPPSPHPALTVIDTGQAELITGITDSYVAAIAGGEAHARALRALAPRSAVVVPLIANERVVGVLSLVSTHRDYDGDDLALAEELARRAALAIENARLYREAREAIGMREEVLRIVSHDLGNPLSAIFVGLKILRRQAEDHDFDAAEQPIAIIHDSAARLRGLIDDLLEVQRIEAGRLAMELGRVEVTALIENAVESMAPLAGEKGLDLSHELRGAVPPVRADWDRLQQVFGNLIGNAIKFTPRGGRIRVTAQPREGSVIFAVADSGPGIAPDDLPHVFERFWRAETAGGLGSGLGLAIARGIVAAHGGEIWAESQPGEGATFYVRLAEATTDPPDR